MNIAVTGGAGFVGHHLVQALIQKGRSGTMQSALPLERELFVGLFDTKDQVEGVQAFLEKRKANWVNG